VAVDEALGLREELADRGRERHDRCREDHEVEVRVS
jgi:hypothetical protein